MTPQNNPRSHAHSLCMHAPSEHTRTVPRMPAHVSRHFLALPGAFTSKVHAHGCCSAVSARRSSARATHSPCTAMLTQHPGDVRHVLRPSDGTASGEHKPLAAALPAIEPHEYRRTTLGSTRPHPLEPSEAGARDGNATERAAASRGSLRSASDSRV